MKEETQYLLVIDDRGEVAVTLDTNLIHLKVAASDAENEGYEAVIYEISRVLKRKVTWE